MREQKWWEKLICFVLRIKVMKPVVVPGPKPDDPVKPTDPIDPASNTVPLSSFEFVSGNKEGHRGGEICENIGGCTLRSTVNDSANRLRMSKGEYYFPNSTIFNKMIAHRKDAAGNLILTGSKEVFELDGFKYRFCGWTLHTDAQSSPFVPKYEVVVPKAEIHDAMRGYLATVAK